MTETGPSSRDAVADARSRVRVTQGALAALWLGLTAAAVVLVVLAGQAQTQSYDDGLVDHYARAGIDYLIAGFLGLGAVVVLAIQLAVLTVQSSIALEVARAAVVDRGAA